MTVKQPSTVTGQARARLPVTVQKRDKQTLRSGKGAKPFADFGEFVCFFAVLEGKRKIGKTDKNKNYKRNAKKQGAKVQIFLQFFIYVTQIAFSRSPNHKIKPKEKKKLKKRQIFG